MPVHDDSAERYGEDPPPRERPEPEHDDGHEDRHLTEPYTSRADRVRDDRRGGSVSPSAD